MHIGAISGLRSRISILEEKGSLTRIETTTYTFWCEAECLAGSSRSAQYTIRYGDLCARAATAPPPSSLRRDGGPCQSAMTLTHQRRWRSLPVRRARSDRLSLSAKTQSARQFCKESKKPFNHYTLEAKRYEYQ